MILLNDSADRWRRAALACMSTGMQQGRTNGKPEENFDVRQYMRTTRNERSCCKGVAAVGPRSLHLRRLIVKALEGGAGPHWSSCHRSNHQGVVRRHHAVSPAEPNWRTRSLSCRRPRLSALYVMLADKGFFPEAELTTFCKRDPSLRPSRAWQGSGVEASQGIGARTTDRVGMALAARVQRKDHACSALWRRRTNEGLGVGGRALRRSTSCPTWSDCRLQQSPILRVDQDRTRYGAVPRQMRRSIFGHRRRRPRCCALQRLFKNCRSTAPSRLLSLPHVKGKVCLCRGQS